MIELTADARGAGMPLNHFWSVCVGAGRAAEGLRADWQEQLRTAARDCGFQYVRFHGLYHDDMFVYHEVDGEPVYNFQYVDALFDRMLEIGVRPFVEFGFNPGDLATEKNTVFWWNGHGSPPKDYGRWTELVSRTVTHWVERYGIDEVRSWYFEVWNEANLKPFFRGSKSQYFELYRVTALAVKAIDPALRVGGPATSAFVPDARFDGENEEVACQTAVIESDDLDSLEWRPVWMEQFLAYCHENALPVDFISCHPYPTDWALDQLGGTHKLTRGVDATPRDLAIVRKIIDASAYPSAEIHLTEWNSSPSARDFTHDFLQAAAFVVRSNLHSLGQVDSLSYWTFTDIFEEGGAGDTIFHGGFGMINLQGIVKPSFHAYRFLHSLGDELLESSPSGVIARDKATGKLSALTYHYPPEMTLSIPASADTRDRAREVLAVGRSTEIAITLTGLRPHAPLVLEILDRMHGNAFGAWEEMGSPEPPTREQAAVLRRAAMATHLEYHNADSEGNFSVRREIEPWSVAFLKEL